MLLVQTHMRRLNGIKPQSQRYFDFAQESSIKGTSWKRELKILPERLLANKGALVAGRLCHSKVGGDALVDN